MTTMDAITAHMTANQKRVGLCFPRLLSELPCNPVAASTTINVVQGATDRLPPGFNDPNDHNSVRYALQALAQFSWAMGTDPTNISAGERGADFEARLKNSLEGLLKTLDSYNDL